MARKLSEHCCMQQSSGLPHIGLLLPLAKKVPLEPVNPLFPINGIAMPLYCHVPEYEKEAEAK
jgi:hypothetical protein